MRDKRPGKKIFVNWWLFKMDQESGDKSQDSFIRFEDSILEEQLSRTNNLFAVLLFSFVPFV